MKRFKRLKLSIHFIPLVSLIIFMSLTQPDALPLPLIVVPVILVFLSFYSLTLLILRLYKNSPDNDNSYKVIALIVGVIPAILLVLQSIGQLVLRDSLLLLSIGLMLSIYISKIRTR
jgi:hypothetical protein